LIARGAEPSSAYSQAHLNAARGAVMPKFKEFSRSKEWTDGNGFCDLKLNLAADASPKLHLTGVHGSNRWARAY
jgi:hypothetical protein